MKKNLFAITVILFIAANNFVYGAPPSVVIPNVWINEIHYDNVGNDTLEGFEIAGTAGTDLACFRVFLYTGASGTSYYTYNLSGVIPNQACGFGTIWFARPANGMQNGPSDGLVLEYAPTALSCGVLNQDTILQFLSYEGVLTATGGRAQGLTSTDIGVTENNTSTPLGTSLQLGGFGTSYSQFTWQTSHTATRDSINQGQSFCAANPSVEFVLTSYSVSEGVGTFDLALSITNPNSNQTQVDVNVLGGGTATYGTDFTFSPLTVTFPANSTFTENVTVTVVDDAIAEGNENFTLKLAYPTNNATLGIDSEIAVTILDNDTLRFNITPPSETVNESVGVVNVPINLNILSTDTTKVTVHLDPAGTTATQGSDFYFNDTTLVWPPYSLGDISVPVTVIDDTVYEPTERVKLKLINPTNGAIFSNDTFLLTILDNDPAPSHDCTDLFFSEYIEGSSNNKALEIFNPTSAPVNLSSYKIFKSINGGTSNTVFGLSGILAPDSVYIVANTSAVAGITSKADSLSGFFNFTGNDALALLHLTDTIDIIGQIGIDPGVSWTVDTGSTFHHTLIRNYYTYAGDTSWATAAATWNAYPIDMFDSLGFHHTAPCGTAAPIIPASIHFTMLNDSVSESAGIVPVVIQIDNPSAVPVDFFVVRNDTLGTATPALDYTFSNQQLVVNNGGTTYDTVYITVIDDQLIEPTETVVLQFLNVSANTNVIQDSTFTLYILDNDTLTVSFLGAGYSYINADTIVEVKVTISTFSDSTTTANVTLAPGSAVNGVDFMFNDTTVTFLPGSIDTQGVWVHLLYDNTLGPNQQINFDLSDVTNGAHIGISAYTLTIINNDSTVGISKIDKENGIKMFPNPVVNGLNIETENEWFNAEITDLPGHIVLPIGKLTNGKNVIDVSALSAGMYFLNIRDGNKVLSKRFIKNE